MTRYTIYPNPGSFNDFLERNPDFCDDQAQSLYTQEISLFRATNPDISYSQISPNEMAFRLEVDMARAAGAEIIEAAIWPSVGDYEVPHILQPRELTSS